MFHLELWALLGAWLSPLTEGAEDPTEAEPAIDP